MTISEFDKKNVSHILSGHGDWFSARLLRLIMKADLTNREKLRQVYPEHVEAYEKYIRGEA
jgi:hypothetical protein